MQKKIVVLPGDGIGPEVISEGVKVLGKIGELYGHQFNLEYEVIAGRAIDELGTPITDETLNNCIAADAVLLGAAGGPKWDNLPGHMRPEIALFKLRKGLNLYANLRPVEVFGPLVESSTLKREVVEGVDLLVVRELTGGIYFGEKKRYKTENGLEEAFDGLTYNEEEIERIARVAFDAARIRSKKVTSVDKANVLESSRLWREVVTRVHQDYPDVELEHMLVDNAAMQIVRYPKQFDVILTENMFGDILSDEASMLAGSIGLMKSASLSGTGAGMYEPVHGTAPDIAGKGIANPLATILSVSMMIRYSFDMQKEADLIDQAVKEVLESGARTGDLAKPGEATVGTVEMGNLIIAQITKNFTE